MRPAAFAALWLAGAAPAAAQVDPAPRQLLQLGWDQPVTGGEAIGYGFYYLNRPGFYAKDTTLRLVVAPVYADLEVGLIRITRHTDLGLGLGGGGYAYGHTEIRRGEVLQRESFVGNGLQASLSLYTLLNPGRKVPLNLVVRGGSAFAAFARKGRTDPGFVLPHDSLTSFARIGLRLGGRPPELGQTAAELSAWYEGKFRKRPDQFGYGDRTLRGAGSFFWTRADAAYTFPETQRFLSATITLATSGDADRLTAWRLGGALPFVSEFPLSLPGYAYQEVTARSFALAESRVLQPVGAEKRLGLGLWGAVATVDYLPGFEQAGSLNSGVGGWAQYQTPRRRFLFGLQYGYGVQALRGSGHGAHSVGLTIQWSLGPPEWALPFNPRSPAERPGGGYGAPLRDRFDVLKTEK